MYQNFILSHPTRFIATKNYNNRALKTRIFTNDDNIGLKYTKIESFPQRRINQDVAQNAKDIVVEKFSRQPVIGYCSRRD